MSKPDNKKFNQRKQLGSNTPLYSEIKVVQNEKHLENSFEEKLSQTIKTTSKAKTIKSQHPTKFWKTSCDKHAFKRYSCKLSHTKTC